MESARTIDGVRWVAIISQDGSEVGRVPLPAGIERVEQSVASPDNRRVSVVGLTSAGKSITVVDIHAIAVVAHHYAFSPAVSPSGRYVVYSRFYPRSVGSAPDTYMVLDVLQKAPLPVIVYPRFRKTPHTRLSDFCWVDDDTVVFLDLSHAGLGADVVGIQFANGSTSRLAVKPLDVDAMVDAAVLDPGVAAARALAGPAIRSLPVDGMWVRLAYSDTPALRVRRVDVDLW